MITSDGWFDWMTRDPGPLIKTYSERNSVSAYIPHSANGDNFSSWRDGRLFNMDRDPDGTFTKQAEASIHGWINKKESDGVIQHYPIWASCWGCGSPRANKRSVAFENQGGAPGNASERLTDFQVEVNVRIIRELAALQNWPPRRPTGPDDLAATLYEHNECTRFGSASTDCPSGRVPWETILLHLAGEEEMAFSRRNGVADGLDKQAISGHRTVNARALFGLPGDAKRVQLQAWVDAGTVVFLDGGTGADAGRVVAAGGASGYGITEPYLDGAGNIALRGEDGAQLARVAILGYWF